MKFILTIGIGISVVLGVFCLMQSGAMAIEKPNYTVEREDGKIQIRSYPSMLLAEVDVTGDRNKAANRGFRKLADFIFGDNVTQEGSAKIAMNLRKLR